MKFSEKLQKLRKENNLSQEGLADKLDVSRQSVSKWESGQTYPEMDKLLTMCKLFNVTLDDLTNDEININGIKTKNKNTFDNLVDDVMYIIDKTYLMFKNMKNEERGKCIGELIIIFLILLFFRIPFEYIISIGNNLLYYLPAGTYLFQSLWTFIINIVYLILFIFTFLYIYKTYFLDKYKEKNTKEEIKTKTEISETKTEETIEKKEKNENITKKVKKEKNHTFGTTLYEILGSIITFCFKGFLIFLCIPFIISFIVLFIIIFLLLIFLFKGIFYFGFIICAIAGILLNWIILKLIISFLFNYKPKFTYMFVTFIIGLALAGIGTGLTIFDIASTDYKDEAPKTNIEYINKEFEIEFTNNLVIFNDYYYDESCTYEIDESLGNKIKIVASYYKDTNFIEMENEKIGDFNKVAIWSYSRYNKKIINTIIENLKNKEIYNYDLLFDYKITIYASNENINKLKTNYENFKNFQFNAGYDSTINFYQKKVDELKKENDNLAIKIEDLNDKIYNLEDENNMLKNKIQEYKDNLQNIIGN